MKNLMVVAMAMLLFASVSFVSADEIKSGLQEGAAIGAFDVTKVAGAEDDGVAVDDNLCYRCKNGARPQVMVFTRSSDEQVVKLGPGIGRGFSARIAASSFARLSTSLVKTRRLQRRALRSWPPHRRRRKFPS